MDTIDEYTIKPDLPDQLRWLADVIQGHHRAQLLPNGEALVVVIQAMIDLNFDRTTQDDVLSAIDLFFKIVELRGYANDHLH